MTPQSRNEPPEPRNEVTGTGTASRRSSLRRGWAMACLRVLALHCLAGGGSALAAVTPPSRPNIVFILADDLGYGDVRCLNPASRIPTPQLDRLAAGGMAFTDAHSSSAVCSPTRYGLLTGRYNWRSRLQSGVLGGMSPPLIERGRLTVPAFLRQHGYHSACIGKWHLGLGWERRPNTEPFGDTIETGPQGWRVDFTRPFSDGPTSVGFDEYFGLAASLDMVPYTFLENDHVVCVPSLDRAFPMTWGRTNTHTRLGPAAPDFEATDVLPTLTRKAVDYIRRRGPAARQGEPFFLYLPLNSPHTPIAPSAAWRGRSGLNAYADFVMETDASVGAILDALDRARIAGNTLVLFASDNGCSPEADFAALQAAGHDPSGGRRGAKADIFEGGHRVPWIVRWPGRIRRGSTSSQLVCLNDFFATCADILGEPLPAGAGEDSVSLLPVLEGRARAPVRETLIHHSIDGSFALREGPWKLAVCPDSGGWSAPRPGSVHAERLPPVQLFNLRTDPRETTNLARQFPETVARLHARLEQEITAGRTTPGAPGSNTVPVAGRRSARAAIPPPPNILLIVADQWRAQAFGFAGDSNVRTPHLDRLARESIRFDLAVSGLPVCSPTRASLLTGQRPLTHGVFLNDVPLRNDATTLPKVLQAAGYDTGLIGKWHLDGHGRSAFIPPERRQGFAYWKVQECTHDYTNSFYYADTPDRRRWEGYDATAQARDAGEYLRRHAAAASPFFLMLSWGPPHDPYLSAPARYRELYDPARLELRPNVPPGTAAAARTNLAGYYAHCTALDEALGDILRTLDDSGLAPNTVVVFTSDHGDMLGSQGLAKKQKPYDEAIRVPLLVRWPAGLGTEARVVRTPFNSEDLMPTLLGLAGRPIPPTVEGLDFSGHLRGGPPPGDDATVIQCVTPFGEWERRTGGREYRGVRTRRHTYVRDLQGPWLLFDNVQDPYQTHNLVGIADHAAVQAELEAVLQRKLRERHDAFLPGPEYVRQWGYTVNAFGTVPYPP